MNSLYQRSLSKLVYESMRFHRLANQLHPTFVLFINDKIILQTIDIQALKSLKTDAYVLVTSVVDFTADLLLICQSIGVIEIIKVKHNQNIETLFKGIKITEVDQPVFEDFSEVQSWFKTTKTPWITLSYGMSMDGKIATYTGDSKYITGPKARQVVHQLRHIHDAILIGSHTAQMDHPLLTTRIEGIEGRHPIKIILDSKASIDLKEPLLYQGKTIIVCKASAPLEKKNALVSIGVTVLEDLSISKGIDLTWLMKTLWALDIHSILVEGGGTIHFSFIEQGLFNRIYAQISPMILGGKDALTPVEGTGFDTLKNATHVAYLRHWSEGQDIIIKSGPQLKL